MDIESITQKMSGTNLAASGILSFEGLGLHLDNEEQAKEIIEKIKSFKNLSVLELSGNTVGVDAAKGIAKALESQPNLKHALWKDMFTGRLKQEIPKALNYLGSGLMLAEAQLVELDLSDNAFGPIGVEGILPLLRSSTCYTLKDIKLNNNGLGIAGGKALAASLIECYKASSGTGKSLALKKFVCGRNRLEDPGAEALAEVFKTIGTLEEISMPQNGINHCGITALAEAFGQNKNLTKINLNDNTFTEVGSSALAKVLTSMHNLKSLDFGDCLMRTEGAKAVAKSIADGHFELEELCLSYNEIKEDGGLEIVSALKNKPKLHTFDINGNQFGEKGIERIKIELEKSKKIATLISNEFSADEGDEDDDDNEEGVDDDNEEGVDDDNEEGVGSEDCDGDDGYEDYEDVDDSEEEEEPHIEHSKHLSPLLRNKDNFSLNKMDPVKDFLDSPNISKLQYLGNEGLEIILQNLEGLSCKEYIDTFLKISQLVTSKDENYQKLKVYTDCIMKKVCKLSEDKSISVFTNSILAQFGLIKDEDKSYKLPENMIGPFLLLAYSVDQKYFPVATQRNLKFFLTSDRNIACMHNGGNEVLNVLNKNGIK